MVGFKALKEGSSNSKRTHTNLAENIFLYTTKSLEPLSFLYEIESATANAVKVTILFEGSVNICAIQNGNILSALSLSTIAQPFQRRTVGLLRSINRSERTHLRFSYEWNFVETEESDEHRNKFIGDRQNSKIRILLEEAKLIDSIGGKRRPYLDVDFPPTRQSYYILDDIYSKKAESKDWLTCPDPESITWKRVPDFMTGKYDVFFGNPSPSDIRQGLMKDSAFLCSIACLAEHPSLIKNIILPSSQTMNPFGKYNLQLYNAGLAEIVTVDDYFPCYPNSGPICSRSHDNELWVLLLEKAYAKIRGSYETLQTGTILEAMIDLTGCPYATISLQGMMSEGRIKDVSLWALLKEWADVGCIQSVAVPKGERPTQRQGHRQGLKVMEESLRSLTGLSAGYSYAIIRLGETSTGVRLLQLRNPWGEGGMEWGGDWSDTCPLWTETIKVLPVLSYRMEESLSIGKLFYSFDVFKYLIVSLISIEINFDNCRRRWLSI